MTGEAARRSGPRLLLIKLMGSYRSIWDDFSWLTSLYVHTYFRWNEAERLALGSGKLASRLFTTRSDSTNKTAFELSYPPLSKVSRYLVKMADGLFVYLLHDIQRGAKIESKFFKKNIFYC